MLFRKCAACGQEFSFYPSQEKKAQCCSRECRTNYSYRLAAQEVRQMTEGECMWFAGLFDGEGSIVQTQRKRTPNGSCRIQVANTVIPLLERIVEYTGVGRINSLPRKIDNPRHADAYVWSVGTGAAREILHQVRPWLIVKAERADALLDGQIFDRQARWDDIYD